MDKAVIILVLTFVLPFSVNAQNWTTFNKGDFGIISNFWGPNSGIKAFKINRQNGDIWWAKFGRIYNISPNGTFTQHSNATDPILPSTMINVSFQHVEIFKDEVYVVDDNGGQIYRFDDNTQWSLFSNATDAFFMSVDEDSLWVCQDGENLQKYVDGIPTYYPDGQERLQSRNGIVWSTSSYASDNPNLIRFYEPLTFEYRPAETEDFVLDNYINDFKFMNNSDTFYLAGNQGFSIAVGPQFIDTLTAYNTINQPSGKIVEFEFDSNDNIWALFGSSIGSCSHLAFLDRSTNEWTSVYDENNSPIEFSTLMSLELDGQDNVYVITPDNLHILEVNTLPPWLNVKNQDLVDFQIYPNPSNGEFTIQIDEGIEVTDIEIVDLYGKVVKRIPFRTNIRYTGDSGVYLIRLKNGQEVIGTRRVFMH
jgi:hypothetical protein